MTTRIHARRGRPGLILAVWGILLGLFAALAPLAQKSLGVPFELIALVMLAPGLASLVLLIRPWRPAPWPRAQWPQVVIATCIAILAVITFFAVLTMISGNTPSWPASDLGAPIAVFLLVQAIGVLSEELGWRGVVQHSAEQFARPTVVSAIAGFLFGVTHIGYWPLGLGAVVTFGVTAALMSVTITRIFVGSLWQRMLPAVVVHLGVNITLMMLTSGDDPLATSLLALGAAMVMCGVAIVITVLLKVLPGGQEQSADQAGGHSA
ncbi:MAG: CPBP family intramembrane glutamic endopeptidase [Microbacterium sp.]|uniref:CPBP family intramembrane glutamic endopeptidase n=1 Tax=Microbacterium sp. TaxID=51671 RepID=UPI003F9DE0C6